VNVAEKKIVFFIRFDRSLLFSGKKNVTVQVKDIDKKMIIAEKEVSLVGPVQ
jgi:hypothetical protein